MTSTRKRARGEGHGRSKMTEARVAELRAAQGTVYGLARRFGISRRQVTRIRRGLHWKGGA